MANQKATYIAEQMIKQGASTREVQERVFRETHGTYRMQVEEVEGIAKRLQAQEEFVNPKSQALKSLDSYREAQLVMAELLRNYSINDPQHLHDLMAIGGYSVDMEAINSADVLATNQQMGRTPPIPTDVRSHISDIAANIMSKAETIVMQQEQEEYHKASNDYIDAWKSSPFPNDEDMYYDSIHMPSEAFIREYGVNPDGTQLSDSQYAQMKGM